MIATDGTHIQNGKGGEGEPCADIPQAQRITTEPEHRVITGNGNLKPWKKGQSGNPRGRPKGRSLTDALRKLLDEGIDGKDLADALAKKAYAQAMKGDFRFFNMIMERLDGKVADQHQADHEHTITVVYKTAELPSE